MKVALLKMQAKSRGGLEKYAGRIAAGFVKKGAEVTLLTTESSVTTGAASQVFPVCKWPGFLKLEQFDRSVARWLQENRADIVFGMERNRMQTHIRLGNGVHAAYLKSRLASEGRIKYALCLINPLHRKLLDLEKSAFEHPKLKKIFVNSRMVRSDILEHYPTVDPAKIELVHNGVEWEEHRIPFSKWQEGKSAALKKFGLDGSDLQLLFIGHGYKRKGLEPLLKALSAWPRKDFHLSVIGKEKNLQRYQNLVERLGLKGKVRFFGPQKEVIPFYQMADALAIPSFYDPFANVTLEALSFGLFVVSSNKNGGYEILSASNGAVIENIASPESIASCLDRCPRKTKESAGQIRASIEHFDFSNQLAKLIDGCLL
jgi:UDP-glucose:(heptosyl)LPS alpha-1,3-glucosyltransferase